jgi:ubiquinone biosynthesis protein COQ4
MFMNRLIIDTAVGLQKTTAMLQHLPETLKTLKAVITLFGGSTAVEPVYDIEDGLKHTKVMAFAVSHMLSHPEIAAIARERYIAPIPNVAKLSQYPEETLGYAYASYMKATGFDPAFYRRVQVNSDANYLLLRLRQTHDLWHVVTGFGTDVPNEIGIKTFELAQTRRPVAGVLVTGGFIKCFLQTPEKVNTMMSCIARGYSLGLTAKPFLAQKWEDHWDKPLAEWRTELGIPLTEAAAAPVRGLEETTINLIA